MTAGSNPTVIGAALQRLRSRFALGPDDLLRQVVYRRLWLSILISSFGGQVTMLALPLTAAVLLHASPTQMGWLTTMEILPFVLFSLPVGVWLDRVRKLPVYIGGELTLAVVVALVPVAWWLGWLNMAWMYVVGFALGCVYTTAGSAAQIVLTQIVGRERLVEAHAKNALANSGAEVAGPGFAGVLIKALGAPVALLVDATMLVVSAAILRGIRVQEHAPHEGRPHFGSELLAGLRFVGSKRLLVTLACLVGGWQLCHNAAVVVQILFATRNLGLSERTVGLCFVAVGAGTVLGSLWGHRLSRRIGPGPSLVLGFAACGAAWLSLALAQPGTWGAWVFAGSMFMFGVGSVLNFINFLSLRQAVTPAPMLGRMTSTMRWLILLPAGPGALIGGWLGEHLGLPVALAFSGATVSLLALVAWRLPTIRHLRTLPSAGAEPASSAADQAVGSN